MRLEFLGTRGETKGRSRRHFMHSSLMLSYRGARVMIDCGDDWLGRLEGTASERETGAGSQGLRSSSPRPAGPPVPRPGAILITHAHPDHAWGLKQGAPCPVYASTDTWDIIGSYPIKDRRVAVPGEPVTYRGITFESFPVVHSLRAPANGYRISAGKRLIFYIPDVVYIPARAAALGGVDLYVGDGATLTRSMVRRRGDALFGHAPIRTQLTWCMKENVPRAIITHCGTEIVEGDEEVIGEKLSEMASDRGVAAEVAYDGMEVILR